MTDRLFIEFHIIQSLPPNNMNRDDTGSPKTAIFGGVRRARVSSQAWKKATRDVFSSILDEEDLGTRTKYAVDLIAEQITHAAPEYSQDSITMAADVLGATGIQVKSDKNGKQTTGALFFISGAQSRDLANLAIESRNDGIAIDKKIAKSILDVKKNASDNAVDIALFGRMVADAPDLNVDAACQVAHAISIHKADTEFDYYTAMDDLTPEDNAGAGMIGTIEFTSSVLYRYATIDVPHLMSNLGDSAEATARAVRAFAHAFITSMPTGKQNTFANRTLPAAVLVQTRNTQPVSLANAFEEPIEPKGEKGRIQLACEALVDQEKMLDDAFDVAPLQTFAVLGAPQTEALLNLGEKVSLSELENRLDQAVRAWSQE